MYSSNAKTETAVHVHVFFSFSSDEMFLKMQRNQTMEIDPAASLAHLAQQNHLLP